MKTLILCILIQIVSVLLLGSSLDYETCENSQKSCGSPPKSFVSGYDQLQHINIVLFGATGDLSKKYLWKSLLQVYEYYLSENKLYKFSVYAISRDEKSEGRKFLSQFFLNLPKCHTEECHAVKKGFSESVQYFKIVTVRDFLNFEDLINENTQSLYGLKDTQRSLEAGRLFYLAIPPSAYLQTTQRIHKHLMPKYGHPWVRIVLEKPFGRDLENVKKLSSELSGLFNDSQIYRVDHYLGKSVVQEMLPFRTINNNTYGILWDNKHIEMVEVVMKEKIAVAGRTNFYNDNGVLRDVMQNHLTEMFTLVAMEIPSKSSITEVLTKKLSVLKQTKLAARNKVVTGQYSTYNVEWLAESNQLDKITNTATFAATLLHVENERWKGVPFVLMAGKKLEKKASYVRVVFRESDGVEGGEEKGGGEEEEEGRKEGDGGEKIRSGRKISQLVFYVDGKLGQFIAASKDLPAIQFKKDWRLVERLAVDSSILGSPQKDMNIYVPRKRTHAYVEVLKGVVDGSRHMFVPVDLLTESWRIWNEIIEDSSKERPRKYLGLDKDGERLLVKHSIEDGVEFIHGENYSIKHN